MPKKYFTAFCVMNSADLRANVFFHGCLVFLESDSTSDGEIIWPLRVVDSYGFYSHNLPYQKSFYEEPLAFFTQLAGQKFRFRGSFGEWRQESIHDLSYGRGLTGRLFEFNEIQFNQIKKEIRKIMARQARFLSTEDTLIDQEEKYKNYSRDMFLALVKSGIDPAEAARRSKNKKPLSEFNSFPLSGGAYSCKTAALGMILDCYDPIIHKSAVDYINETLKGTFIESFIPRLTDDLDEIILHCASDDIEVCGEKSKYPYYAWDKLKSNDFYVLSAGSWYLDQSGCKQPLLALNEEDRAKVRRLKVISRLCDINISDDVFRAWHDKLNRYFFKIATGASLSVRHIWTVSANDYINKLLKSDVFKDVIRDRIPTNLTQLVADLSLKEEHSHDRNGRAAAL